MNRFSWFGAGALGVERQRTGLKLGSGSEPALELPWWKRSKRELEWCLHMQNYILIWYSAWLLGCCYVVTMVCLVSKTLLALNVVARLFLGYSGWLPVVCYAVTMVFLVSRTLLALKVVVNVFSVFVTVLKCGCSGVPKIKQKHPLTHGTEALPFCQMFFANIPIFPQKWHS